MEIKGFTFQVNARCKAIYRNEDLETIGTDKIDILLDINDEQAESILFDDTVYSNGLKIRSKRDNNGKKEIQIIKNKDVFIVLNSEQVCEEIKQGYIKILMLKKISNLLDINTSELINRDIEIEDEFGEDETFKTKDLGNGNIEVINNPNITPA